MTDNIHDKLFNIIFENPTEANVLEFFTDGPLNVSEGAPSPFGDQNLHMIFGRLANCDVFTPAAREKFLQLSDAMSQAVDIETEEAFDTHQKVKRSLTKALRP